MKHKQLSPGPDGGGSATDPTNSFDILSSEMEFELETNNLPIPLKEEKKPEDEFDDNGDIIDPIKKAEEEAAAKAAEGEAAKSTKLGEDAPQKYTAEEEVIIAKFTPEQKADFEAGKIDIKGEPIEEGFKGDGAKVNPEDEDSSWIIVAKELGYPDLKEDSIEAFKEAEAAKIEAIRKEADVKAFDKHIEEMPIKEQLIVRGLKTGLTMEQIEKPIKTLDSLLAMNDADLLALDMKEKGLKDDVIKYQIQKLVEEENLEKEIAPLRKDLQDKREGIEQSLLAQVKVLETQKIEENKAALKEDFVTFRKSLDTIQDLMGTKLSKANKEEIAASYEKGEYHDIFKDHKKVAEFLIWDKYKKEAQTNLVNKALEDKQRGHQNKIHVLPPVKAGAGSSVSKVQGAKDGKVSEFASVANAELEEDS